MKLKENKQTFNYCDLEGRFYKYDYWICWIEYLDPVVIGIQRYFYKHYETKKALHIWEVGK